jgi:DNA-binding FadR family transcriptional regulator
MSESGLPESVERVVSSLRGDILRRRYRSGERLPSERELADRLGVNRGAVREAFRVLAQLGLVSVGPGGARATALEEASIDVLSHLLMLDGQPDPGLVDQVLEAHSVLAAGWIRVVIDRGSDSEIEECRAVLRQVCDPAATQADHSKLIEGLVQRVGDSTNLVLRLMRRSLRVHFWEQLAQVGIDVIVPIDMVARAADELDRALVDRDGTRASEIIYSVTKAHRERILTALDAPVSDAMPPTDRALENSP